MVGIFNKYSVFNLRYFICLSYRYLCIVILLYKILNYLFNFYKFIIIYYLFCIVLERNKKYFVLINLTKTISFTHQYLRLLVG